MRKVTRSGFDVHMQEMMEKNPKLAALYARELAELPLSTQLAILRRRQWLSQKDVAKTLKVKQPHVARIESAGHDPRLSSVESQAKALHCRLMVIPDEMIGKVAELVADGQNRKCYNGTGPTKKR